MQSVWLFPFFVAAMWLGVLAMSAWLSGWTKLSRSFRASGSLRGETFRFVSGSLRAGLFPVSYRTVLIVTVGEHGFGMSMPRLMRFRSPPLFIPWREVASVEKRRFLGWRRVTFRLRDPVVEITLQGHMGRLMAATYFRACPPDRR